MAEKGVEEQVLAMERLRSFRDVWFTIYDRNVPRQTQTR